MSKEKKEESIVLPLIIALGSLGFFALMFALMHYFELAGADTSYFDDGTEINLGYINTILPENLRINLAANQPNVITTLKYSICMGAALIVSGGAIILANRQSDEVYETTDAV